MGRVVGEGGGGGGGVARGGVCGGYVRVRVWELLCTPVYVYMYIGAFQACV